jgi:23S rRNA (cytidine1920-2'-O)/16S rRNA (cytidine1409-2'-O)-methyltransferase
MIRLDALLVARGLVPSRARARAAIEAGGVRVDGEPATSASQKTRPDAVLDVVEAHDFVGRGALKLDHALTLWPVPVEGRVVLDVGASTGGFTEVCLRREARRVFAVDVGSGQLHGRITDDPRVENLERTDARDLTATIVDEVPELIVCDASFIGLAKILPAALGLAGVGADLVALVKPQFEMEDRSQVGRGGVVRDAGAREAALARVCDWLAASGWGVRATMESPITGGDGNVEFLLWARRDGPGPDRERPPVAGSTGGLRHVAERQGG